MSHADVRKKVLSQVILCFIVQMSMCILLCKEMFDDNTLAKFPESSWMVILRFICAVVLHMTAQGEIAQEIGFMKFSLNHDYRFNNYVYPFLAGFLQAVSIIVIELVSFVVIMSSATYLDVVMNFLALYVISEFDDIFYIAIGDISDKELISNAKAFEELYKVTRTTSIYCPSSNEANNIEDDTPPNRNISMKVNFSDRTTAQKVMRVIYRFFRILQISVWFYFLPFVALLSSYLLPYFY